MKISTCFPYVQNCTKKLVRLCCLCIAVLIPLTSCSQMKTIKWREEVKLSNGQMIIVEREEDFRKRYGGSTVDWSGVHDRLRAVLLPQNRELVWDGKLSPMAIDTGPNGEIFLVAIVGTIEDMHEYSVQPGVDHIAFKYKGNGEWTRIPIGEVPRDMRPNLFTNAGHYFNGQGHPTSVVLDWATKEKDLADPSGGPMYKSWPTK